MEGCVDFRSYGSVTDRSDALPMFQDSAIDYLAVYKIDYTDKSFSCYHGNVLEYCAEKQGHRRDDTWGACYLYITYTPIFTVSLVFSWGRECEHMGGGASGGYYIFHVLHTKCRSAHVNSLTPSFTTVRPKCAHLYNTSDVPI